VLPWDVLQLDLSVQWAPTEDGYRCLLIVVDCFSGFVLVRPLRDRSAVSVATSLFSAICDFGPPRIILADFGGEFRNELFDKLSELFGFRVLAGSPYHSQAVARAERTIRSISSSIKKMLRGAGTSWARLASIAQLAHNSAISSLTASTPFALFMGRVVSALNENFSSWDPPDIDIPARVAELRALTDRIFPAIRARVARLRRHQHTALNERRYVVPPDRFKVGSRVMMRDPRRARKSDPVYVGPYWIYGITETGSYLLRDENGEQLQHPVTVSHLKLLHDRAPEPSARIRSILGHSGQPPHCLYLVHWHGEGPQSATWVPSDEFNDVSIIHQYWTSDNVIAYDSDTSVLSSASATASSSSAATSNSSPSVSVSSPTSVPLLSSPSADGPTSTSSVSSSSSSVVVDLSRHDRVSTAFSSASSTAPSHSSSSSSVSSLSPPSSSANISSTVPGRVAPSANRRSGRRGRFPAFPGFLYPLA